LTYFDQKQKTANSIMEKNSKEVYLFIGYDMNIKTFDSIHDLVPHFKDFVHAALNHILKEWNFFKDSDIILMETNPFCELLNKEDDEMLWKDVSIDKDLADNFSLRFRERIYRYFDFTIDQMIRFCDKVRPHIYLGTSSEKISKGKDVQDYTKEIVTIARLSKILRYL